VDNIYQTLGKPKSRDKLDIFLDSDKIRYQKKQEKEQKSRKYDARAWMVLGSMGQMGFMIVLPIAGGAMLGNYLDAMTGWYPKLTIGLLLFGVTIAGFSFIHTIRDVVQKLKD
jgi:ATP synthase protein I